jgi:formylmethanofuran dehydrogenase subunit C
MKVDGSIAPPPGVPGSFQGPGVIDNNGTINNNGNWLVHGEFQNPGGADPSSGLVVNYGNFTLINGSMNNNGTFVNTAPEI